MALFHRHSFTTFVCHADEIEGFQILGAVNVHTKNKIWFRGEKVICPSHGEQHIQTHDNTCRSCNYKFVLDERPNLNTIMITYKKCASCGHYLLDVQCGKNRYVVNKEYVAQKIELLKKKKDDEEVERLLNLGNPEYKAPKEGEKPDYEKMIKDYLSVIDKLQENIRLVTGALNKSLVNDGIWEALPMSVKRDLVARYGRKAATYQAVNPEELIKNSGVLELKKEIKHE